MQVRPVREPLGHRPEPWQAPALIGAGARPFALLGEWAGCRVVAGSAPVRVGRPDEDPFALLDEQPRVVAGGAEVAVGGGWAGTLGFALARAVEPTVMPAPPSGADGPPWTLAFYDHVLVADAEGSWWLEALVAPGREAAVAAWFAQVRARAAALVPGEAPAGVRTAAWRWTPSPAGHGAAVAAAVERIHAGDLFQANLCARLDSRLLDGTPADLFATAWHALRPPQAAWVQGPWGAVCSLSPERFLARAGREVVSSPIKGTRAAGPQAAAELAGAEKDRAEHVMIVDLVRNDLGRVCAPGSVRVTALMQPRPAAGLLHLVSDVAGTLRPEVGDGELLRAAFPPGSVTGAPKVAALQAIHALESTARGTYTGAIGLASPLAGLHLNVAIRTVECTPDGRLWLGAGGGVVADSDPAAEAEEARAKAAPVLGSFGGAIAAARARTEVRGRRPRRLGPVPVGRPDPALGLYETLRVTDGRPEQAEAHLQRLRSSVAALWERELPAEVSAALSAAARGVTGPSRMRLDLRPGRSGPEVTTAVTPLRPWPAPVLRTEVLSGGMGPHKLADRRLWEALAGGHGGGHVLVVDLDGFVLETDRASVLARIDGVWVSPPADGRILPGTGVARVGAARRPLHLDELHDAEEVALVNALRGPVRMEVLDGHRLPQHLGVR